MGDYIFLFAIEMVLLWIATELHLIRMKMGHKDE